MSRFSLRNPYFVIVVCLIVAVVGLTSAATIWVVAAIGVALGSGFYLEGIGTTLVVLAVLVDRIRRNAKRAP